MKIKPITVLFLLSLSVCKISTARTIITFVVPDGSELFDSVTVNCFTENKTQGTFLKNNSRISFAEKYPDLYTIVFFKQGRSQNSTQLWLDTGNVKIVLKSDFFSGVPRQWSRVMDTIIGSPLTYKALEFLSKYVGIENSKDTTAVNDYLVSIYKENIDNPLSFVAGEFFYVYNKRNTGRFIQISQLDELQNSIIKQNAFYSMMLHHRLRPTERTFIDFFNNQPLELITGDTARDLLKQPRVRAMVFLNEQTPASLRELSKLEKAIPRFTSKKQYLLIAVNKSHYNSWKKRLTKLNFKNIVVVDGDALLNQTGFLPCTKFYYIAGREINGYYDSFADLEKRLFQSL